MTKSNIIDMTEIFQEEREVNAMVGAFEQEVSQVIYVDFKKKQVQKVVTYSENEVTVEYDIAG